MERELNGLFVRVEADKNLPKILLKVSEGTGAAFEVKLLKKIQEITSDWSTDIVYLEDKRKDMMNIRLIPILILSIITSFLIFNVALGLFGVLWQNISNRTEEIGVRRAMGSTRQSIMLQFIGETAVLATLSIVIGIFFAIQFPSRRRCGAYPPADQSAGPQDAVCFPAEGRVDQPPDLYPGRAPADDRVDRFAPRFP